MKRMALPLLFFLHIKVIGLEHWETDIKLFSFERFFFKTLKGLSFLLWRNYMKLFLVTAQDLLTLILNFFKSR